MPSTLHKRNKKKPKLRKKVLHRIITNDLITRVSDVEYRKKVKRVYGGPKGALLAVASTVSLHIPLGERLFRTKKFDLTGIKSVLDIGCGAGQIIKHLLKYGDPDMTIVGTDLSQKMLSRGRNRINDPRPHYVAADLANLPFADNTFDCATCGYVLEHLPTAEAGLTEIARVLAPGGKLFLMATEDSFSGAWTSRLWYCRTYNRKELTKVCESLGLIWKKEVWFTPVHKLVRAGGICVVIEKKR